MRGEKRRRERGKWWEERGKSQAHPNYQLLQEITERWKRGGDEEERMRKKGNEREEKGKEKGMERGKRG